jgi:hypothetical protein
MSDQKQSVESSAKIYSINAFIDLVKDKLKTNAKSIIVLFKHDSLKLSACGVMYCLPLIYKLDETQPRIISAKKFNEMVDMNCCFINLREGLMKKIHKLDYKYFAMKIECEEAKWETDSQENKYHPTSISYIKDKDTIEKINAAENELNAVSEFKL